MAPSCSEHPELFDSRQILDGKQQVVGVIFFPVPSSTAKQQLAHFDDSLSHINTLLTVLGTHKIKSTLAPRYTPLINWLAWSEKALSFERGKLLDANKTLSNSTAESTVAPRSSDVR